MFNFSAKHTLLTLSIWTLCSTLHAESTTPIKKYGIAVTGYTQNQDYQMTDLSFGGVPDTTGLGGLIDISDDVDEFGLQFDVWVFPFLNLHTLVGYIEGETEVTVPAALLSPGDAPAPGTPPLRVDFDYDGYVYGGGLTLAGAIDNVFATLTASYTEADLDDGGSTYETWTLSPKIGLMHHIPNQNKSIYVWIGAEYQHEEFEQDTALFPGPGGQVSYTLEAEEKWNALIGLELPLHESWVVDIEYGFGKRQHFSVSCVYRF